MYVKVCTYMHVLCKCVCDFIVLLQYIATVLVVVVLVVAVQLSNTDIGNIVTL